MILERTEYPYCQSEPMRMRKSPSYIYSPLVFYEKLDTAAWQKMMNRVREGLPPTEEDEIDVRRTVAVAVAVLVVGMAAAAQDGDSMILARVDPQNKKVTMVSLHRDTEVEIEGNGVQKLNAA